jgi:hypothetical protein
MKDELLEVGYSRAQRYKMNRTIVEYVTWLDACPKATAPGKESQGASPGLIVAICSLSEPIL